MLTHHKKDVVSTPPAHYQSEPPPYNNTTAPTTSTIPPFEVHSSGTFTKVLSVTLPGKDKDHPEYTATTQRLSHPDFTIQRTGGPVLAQATYTKFGSSISADLYLPSSSSGGGGNATHIKITRDSHLHVTRSFALFGTTWQLKRTNQGTEHTLGKDFKLVDAADPERPYVMFRTEHGLGKWGHFEFLRGDLSQEQVDAVVAVVLMCVDKIKRQTRQNGATAGGVAAGGAGV